MTDGRNAASKVKSAVAPGAFVPLRHRLFAVIWTATVLGNVGTFMRDVASAWLVTDVSASPAAVAMIQAAGTLPVFLLAIPAGVLSDILDRRRFLIGIQIGLALVSTASRYWPRLEMSRSRPLSVSHFLAASAPHWRRRPGNPSCRSSSQASRSRGRWR